MDVLAEPLWCCQITLAPQAPSVAEVRGFVRRHLNLHDLPLLVDDMTLVASELATNALLHAGTEFTVTMTASAEAVTLTVGDGSSTRPSRVDRAIDDIGGRGIAIVDAVASSWGVEVSPTVGKGVWASFDVE